MKIFFCLLILVTLVGCKKDGGSSTDNGGGLCSINGGTNCPTPNPGQETPFSIGYIDPPEGTSNFAADDLISIQFNRAVDLSSLIYNSGTSSMDNLTLKDDTGEEVLLQVTVQNDLLQIKPMFSLTSGRRYTFTMKSTVRDTLGKNVDRGVTSNFTVAKQPGTNPGTNPMLSWEDGENVKRNIKVDRFELHYGQVQRTGTNFLYQRVSEIPVSQAQFDSVTGKYIYELRDQLESNRTYYYSMKACNSDGCSDYSGEVSKYQTGN